MKVVEEEGGSASADLLCSSLLRPGAEEGEGKGGAECSDKVLMLSDCASSS